MQIFLQSRGTDWSALFCASKPACSCIYRDGRCLTDSGMTQPAPDFLYQGMHLPVPGAVFFVVHAVFQITQYMCKAFLVAGSILIKGYIMIVDQCPLIVFNNCALYSSVSLFVPGKIEHTAIRNCTYKYIRIFPVCAGIGTVCMHDRGSNMSRKSSLRWDSVFSANDRQRLFIMPFDMFIFPSVRSDKNLRLLSIDVQQPLFSRNRKARKFPP